MAIDSGKGPGVLGVGGVFLRARDPAALGRWYAENLGIAIDPGWNGTALVGKDGDMTVFSLFSADNDYFDRAQAVMVNWRVADLEAMRAWLIGRGVRVDDKVESSEFGKFGWAWDAEGNKLELWQPPADA
ncbi:MAG: VOC family protein [Deltaproteobacteria bacterium]|nr:VOC family protein [Deltaproteobacteria bacterium]